MILSDVRPCCQCCVEVDRALNQEAFCFGAVRGHAEGSVGDQRLLEHPGGARVVAVGAAIQQHLGMQTAQVGQLDAVVHACRRPRERW